MNTTISGIVSNISKLGNNVFKGGLKNPSLASSAIDIVGGFIPDRSEYSGTYGNITKAADSIYDTASDVIAAVPGWGTAASLGMKALGVVNKGINAIGGGTDGMCVCAGTLIYTKTGKLVPIEKLQPSDGILGWNPSTKQIVPQEITNVITPTEKECIKIILKDGSYLQCSIDHPILSNLKDKAESHRINGKRVAYRNWEFHRADALKIGNWVGKANNIDFWGDIELPQAYLVGMLIGDGTYGKGSSCRIFSADPDTWKYIEENDLGVINHCDDNRPEKYSKEVRTYRIINGMELMRSLGLVYQTHENKTLPKDIFKYTKDSICKLIAGLYDTDGSISINTDKSQYSITLYQSNKSLLEEVQTQLYKLGIKSTIGTRKAAQYKIGGRICNSKISYRLELIDYRSIQNFYKLIPLNISYKKEALEKIYNLSLTKKVREHSDLSGASQVKIIDIIPLGKQTVYNLTCTPNHTYIANNIITHNTKTDALLGSNFLGWTPIGMLNGFGGKRSNTLEQGQSERDTMASVGGSYMGSVGDWQNSLKYSNKKYGLFSSSARKKANKRIDDANYKMNLMTDISNNAQNQMELANNMADINNMRYQMQLQGGYDPTTRLGRSGLKIEYIKRAKRITNKVKDKQSDIMKHQSGGTIEESFFIPTDWEPQDTLSKFQKGGSINIIPEGALHARLHHMEDAKDLTKKGIPVVDNQGVQQAEIERNEIIFRKEVTEKLEQLAEDGSDEAALECGKLLAKEIVENTDDKTGLVPTLFEKKQDGGIVNLSNTQNFLNQLNNSWSQQLSNIDFKTPSSQDLHNLQNTLDTQAKDKIEKQARAASMINTAVQGVANAIQAGKEQKAINKAREQQEKDLAIQGTGDMSGNEKMYQQLQQNILPKVPTAQKGIKLPYEEWVKDVNPDYLSPLYDLKTAYTFYPEIAEKWKQAVNSDTPDKYLNLIEKNANGEETYPYHLPSVAQLPNGDYIFLKLGKENENKELQGELNFYNNDKDFKNLYDLIFDKEANRYFYKKKQQKSSKNKMGGILKAISDYDDSKLDKLESILKIID